MSERDYLYAVAMRLTHRHHDAEDLVQETYVKAATTTSYVEEGQRKAWLRRILTNLFYDKCRQQARRPVDLTIDGEVPDVYTTPSAETVFGNHDLGNRLADAIAELPEHERHALILVDVEGRTYAEAAQLLGIPSNTIGTQIFRARRHLRASLADLRTAA